MNNELLTADEMRKRMAFAEVKYADARMAAVDTVVERVLDLAKMHADARCNTFDTIGEVQNAIEIKGESLGQGGVLTYDYRIENEYDPVILKLKELGYTVSLTKNTFGVYLHVSW